MRTPVDTINISLKGSIDELNVWEGMTLADVRSAVSGVKPSMVCMGKEVGATASTQLSDSTVVCKHGAAVYTRLTFAQGGESNAKAAIPEEAKQPKKLPTQANVVDRKEVTITVTAMEKFLNKGAKAFNRYHALDANPKADKGNLAVAFAGDTMTQADAIATLRNVANTLPEYGTALTSEAANSDASATALVVIPVAVRVFSGAEIKGDFKALTDYLAA